MPPFVDRAKQTHPGLNDYCSPLKHPHSLNVCLVASAPPVTEHVTTDNWEAVRIHRAAPTGLLLTTVDCRSDQFKLPLNSSLMRATLWGVGPVRSQGKA